MQNAAKAHAVKCPACGKVQKKARSKFCSYCSAEIESKTEPPPPMIRQCRKCKEETEDEEATYCWNCRHRLSDSESEDLHLRSPVSCSEGAASHPPAIKPIQEGGITHSQTAAGQEVIPTCLAQSQPFGHRQETGDSQGANAAETVNAPVSSEGLESSQATQNSAKRPDEGPNQGVVVKGDKDTVMTTSVSVEPAKVQEVTTTFLAQNQLLRQEQQETADAQGANAEAVTAPVGGEALEDDEPAQNNLISAVQTPAHGIIAHGEKETPNTSLSDAGTAEGQEGIATALAQNQQNQPLGQSQGTADSQGTTAEEAETGPVGSEMLGDDEPAQKGERSAVQTSEHGTVDNGENAITSATEGAAKGEIAHSVLPVEAAHGAAAKVTAEGTLETKGSDTADAKQRAEQRRKKDSRGNHTKEKTKSKHATRRGPRTTENKGSSADKKVSASLTDDGTPVDAQEESSSQETGTSESDDADTANRHSSAPEDSSQQTGSSAKRRGRHNSQGNCQKEKGNDLVPRQPAQQMLKVIFHVVVSNKFKKLASNNHRVVLCWGRNKNDQPLSDHSISMQYNGYNKDCGRLYYGEVEFECISKGPRFKYYNYGVEHKEKIQWESFNQKAHGEDTESRELRLASQQDVTKDTWHVYDWMAYPEKVVGTLQDAFCYFIKIPTALTRDFKSACSLFLPSFHNIRECLCDNVEHSSTTAEELLDTIQMISKNTFADIPAGVMLWFVNKCIEEYLVKPLLSNLNEIIIKEPQKRTVVLAMFIIHLATNAKLAITSDDKTILLQALLIKPRTEDRSCPDIQHLMNHFRRGMTDKKIFADRILSLFKESTRDPNPAWICAVPLVHILLNTAEPFCPAPVSAKHQTPIWWGTLHFDDKVRGFKEATRTTVWVRSVAEMYKKLRSLDCFLAVPMMERTFVATLNLREMIELLSSDEVVPTEIILANFFYQAMDKTDDFNHTFEQSIINSLNHAFVIFKTKYSPGRELTECEFQLCLITAQIGLDLLEEITQKSKSPLNVTHAAFRLQIALLSKLAGKKSGEGSSSVKQICERFFAFMRTWSPTVQHLQLTWSLFLPIMEDCYKMTQEITDKTLKDHISSVLYEHVSNCMKTIFKDLEQLSICLSMLERPSPYADVAETIIDKPLETVLMRALASLGKQKESVVEMSEALGDVDLGSEGGNKFVTRVRETMAGGNLQSCYVL